MIVESTLAAKLTKLMTSLGATIIALGFNFSPVWVIVVMGGLILGWLARIARLIHQNKTFKEVYIDTLVSLLIGGANGLLATLLIYSLGLNYVQGIGAAFLCAFAGIKALEQGIKWIFKKLVDDFYDPTEKK